MEAAEEPAIPVREVLEETAVREARFTQRTRCDLLIVFSPEIWLAPADQERTARRRLSIDPLPAQAGREVSTVRLGGGVMVPCSMGGVARLR